jgi:hypothetical protein
MDLLMIISFPTAFRLGTLFLHVRERAGTMKHGEDGCFSFARPL